MLIKWGGAPDEIDNNGNTPGTVPMDYILWFFTFVLNEQVMQYTTVVAHLTAQRT